MNTPSIAESQKIHFVYFTCARHWQYFNCSLRSLLRLRYTQLGGIYIYVDGDDYFNEGQIMTLRAFCAGIQIIKSRRITGWGENTVTNETRYFADVSAQIAPGSYIAKTDSDVIFRSDKVFSAVLGSSADLAGYAYDRHAPMVYTGGGCYFIKGPMAGHLLDYPRGILQETLSLINNQTALKRGIEILDVCPEDAAICAIVKQKGGKVAYIPQFSSSIMHFSGNKSEILKFDDRLYWLFRYHWRPFVGRLLPVKLRNALKGSIGANR
jgi:hypothetical protein